jgi:catechol 2,3-dioxygenase-like lactoylglutathione lyase family enzyme
MIVSSSHTGFVVRDMEKSISFYRDVLGLELTGRGENDGLEKHTKLLGFPRVHLKSAGFDLGNGHILELLEYAHPRGREEVNDRNDLGAAHLAFFVTDIDELYEETSRRGLNFINPPTPTYRDGKLIMKSSYAQDPDGHWLEFMERF